MADEVPRAVHSAPKPCARSSASTEHAPATVGANSTSADVEAIDDGPAVRGPEAARTNLVSMESSQAASSSSDRHEIHPTRGAASVSRQAECFSVAELKERALHMFVAAIGDAPRPSRWRVVMCAVTAQLLINVTAAIEQLMGTPRKPGSHRAEMVRCCGELDKEEARGWLVADCVGRPLLHRNDDRSQNDARDVGKRVLERAGRAKADIAAAKETGRDAVRAATTPPKIRASSSWSQTRRARASRPPLTLAPRQSTSTFPTPQPGGSGRTTSGVGDRCRRQRQQRQQQRPGRRWQLRRSKVQRRT